MFVRAALKAGINELTMPMNSATPRQIKEDERRDRIDQSSCG